MRVVDEAASLPRWCGHPHGYCWYTELTDMVYSMNTVHDNVMTWKYLLHYWPFVRGIRKCYLQYWFIILFAVNKVRQRQNGCHFAHDIFRCIFFHEKCCILIPITLKFIPYGSVNTKTALVLVMAEDCTDNKPLPEPVIRYHYRCPLTFTSGQYHWKDFISKNFYLFEAWLY